MSKILLINTLPYTDYWSIVQEPEIGYPLGLLSLASSLKRNGHTPVIVDPTVERNYLYLIKAHVVDSLWVGITTMTNGIGSAIEISKFVKSIKNDTPVCWGGFILHCILMIS